MSDQAETVATAAQPEGADAPVGAETLGSNQEMVNRAIHLLATDKALSVDAMGGLSADSKKQLVNSIVQSADPDNQKQVATGAIAGLSADSKKQLVNSIVQSADPDNQKQVATAAIDALPQADQEAVATGILGIPDQKTQQKLWYIVIGTMAGAIFIFGILTFVLVILGDSAEGVLALATTALGGVVGLVSTSPVSSRRGR